MRKWFIFLLVCITLFSGSGLFLSHAYSGEVFDVQRRSSKETLLYDYAGILTDMEEYVELQLSTLKEHYNIEAVMVTLPSAPEGLTIQQLAVQILENWKIGQGAGRGVLLLLLDDKKEIRLEVSLELEDVFTDAFCGFIADRQLRSYYLSGNLATGMTAIMEELEQRAYIKEKGDYSSSMIQGLDDQLLAGGAGIRRDLSKYQKAEEGGTAGDYPAGATPDEAWQNLMRSRKEGDYGPNLGVYTEVMKLLYRQYGKNSAQAHEDYERWGNKEYTIKQNANYAVVSFGKKDGWDNAPFLLCRTEEGWKFDIVQQRELVRMGRAPKWGIERGEHPYMSLLGWAPFWMQIDIDYESQDIYRVENDAYLANEILRLEQRIKDSPDDFDALVELGRIGVMTNMRPNQVYPYLNKAKKIDPDSPLPYKYLALGHVSSSYQFQAGIREIKEFLKREPDSAFGHKFLGFLYYQEKEYGKAVKEFERALELEPNHGYTLCKLSRAYAQLHRLKKIHFPSYKQLSLEAFEKAKNAEDIYFPRIEWLRKWLKKRKILEKS